MFLPFNSGCIKIEATVANSSLPEQRTIPAFLKSAFTATSGLANAPVCEDAAREPASELPDLIAAILHPLRIKEEACFNNISGLSMFSIYNNLTELEVAGS